MYNVVILGAGQIASGFDNPDDKYVVTHAHGVTQHPEFKLLGFYDVDYQKSVSAAKKWNTKAFKSLNEIDKADIVVVTTPDEFHLKSIKDALKLESNLIILEKPIAKNVHDTLKIIELTKNIPVVVNFTRRFVTEFQKLAEQTRNGDFGEFVTGAGLYGKGFVHNGSHMIDLLELLVGKIESKKVINEFVDFYNDDPTKTLDLRFNDGQTFLMQGIDCRKVTVFELDLFFEFNRIKIVAAGKRILSFGITENSNGYKVLDYKGETATDLDFAMYNLYQNTYEFLSNRKELLSTVKTAYQEVLYD